MDGKLRNMTAVYITCAGRMLLLYRQGSRIVNNLWVGSAGGHFEEFELNDARACALREMEEELGLKSCLLRPMRGSPNGLPMKNCRLWKCRLPPNT